MAENTHIDAKGLKCPMPVIKLQQKVRQSHSGEHISIECTDPGAEKDIRSWSKVNRHRFVSTQAIDTTFRDQPVKAWIITVEVG
ncbi:MAG: sulfurtransferase TusA family protein [Hydrogenovibrio sp.]|nr:sulfurtransferase TusA family protein [Hydrogenovibrio sp.]